MNYAVVEILVNKGYHLYPVRACQKYPFLKGGLYYNSFTAEEELQFRGVNRIGHAVNYNVAICCDNFIVIDIDNIENSEGENGIDTFGRILQDCGVCNVKPMVKTPKGGYHYYFRMPPSFLKIKPKAKIKYGGIETSVDVRCFGAGALVMGEVYIDKRKIVTGEYEPIIPYIDFPSPTDLPELPQKLLDILPVDGNRPGEILKCGKDPEKAKLIKKLYDNCMFQLKELYGEKVIDQQYKERSFFDMRSTKTENRQECAVDPTELPSVNDSEGNVIDDINEEEGTPETPLRAFEDISLSALHPDIVSSLKRAKRHTTLPFHSVMVGWFTIMGSQTSTRIWADRKYLPTTIHGFIIAQSGDGKSDLLSFLKDPIVNKQVQENETYENKLAEYQKALKTYEKAKKTNKGNNKNPPKEPKKRYYCNTSAVTLQGVKRNLTIMDRNKQPHSMLVFAEEGTVFFGGMNRFNGKGNTDDFSSWTIILDGEAMIEDNISSSYSFRKSNVGVLALIQDDIFPEQLRKLKNQLRQGFFSRWVYDVVPRVVRTEPYQVSRDKAPEENETTYEERLEEKIRCYTDTIELSDEAYEVYQSFAYKVDEIRNEHIQDKGIFATFSSSSAKHGMKLLLRLAGIIHVVNQCALEIENEETSNLATKKETSNTVTKEEIELAVDLFFYYREKFLRYLKKEVGLILASNSRNPYNEIMHKVARKVHNFKIEKCKSPTINDIRQRVRALKDADLQLSYTVADLMVENEYIEDYKKNSNKLILTPQGTALGKR